MPYCFEPLPNIVFLDVKSQIADDMSDADLAAAYADVSNKLSALMHELDDLDFDPVHDKVEQSYALWRDLEETLYAKIVSILAAENEAGSQHTITGIGTHYVVRPFMEREGFRDGEGWWIAEK